MTGKSHVQLGIYIGITGAVFLYKEVDPRIGFAIGSIIGSAFPDIDSPKSMISKHIPILPKILNKIFGHRAYLHSLMHMFILTVLLRLPSQAEYVGEYFKALSNGFAIGFLSHLLQDSLTKDRIKPFYPFSKMKIGLGLFKSGSRVEPIFNTVLGILWTLPIVMFSK